VNRIDPHENRIGRQQLLAHLVREFLIINRRLSTNVQRGQLFEDPMEAIVLRSRGPAGFGVAAPEDRDLMVL
jgi:hypothetical protein